MGKETLKHIMVVLSPLEVTRYVETGKGKKAWRPCHCPLGPIRGLSLPLKGLQQAWSLSEALICQNIWTRPACQRLRAAE